MIVGLQRQLTARCPSRIFRGVAVTSPATELKQPVENNVSLRRVDAVPGAAGLQRAFSQSLSSTATPSLSDAEGADGGASSSAMAVLLPGGLPGGPPLPPPGPGNASAQQVL